MIGRKTSAVKCLAKTANWVLVLAEQIQPERNIFDLLVVIYILFTSVSKMQFTRMSYSSISLKGPPPLVSSTSHLAMADLNSTKF